MMTGARKTTVTAKLEDEHYRVFMQFLPAWKKAGHSEENLGAMLYDAVDLKPYAGISKETRELYNRRRCRAIKLIGSFKHGQELLDLERKISERR